MNQRPFQDLVDVFSRSVAEFRTANFLGTKTDGTWQWMTYGEFGARVDNFRGGLASLGIGVGDTVAIISANRAEWAIAAYAVYGLGARFCPMYESQLQKDWRYIIEDSGAKVVLTSTYAIYEQVKDWPAEEGPLEKAYCMGLPAEDAASFQALEKIGEAAPAAVVELTSDAVCGFIYTSGTTGKPKGVLLTHGNIVSNINGVMNSFPIDTADISVSFLPWAHSFGQTCELHCLFASGSAIAVAESVEKLVDNFGEVRPTILFSVPRIFNRIYDGLQKKLADEGGLAKVLFDAAFANAEKRKALEERGKSSGWVDLKHKVLDRLVFSKVRARFGGRLRYAFSGGAALSPEVGEFIDTLGIMVYEGYGLTETSPIATANCPGARKMGSVGRPIQDVEVFIDTSVVDDADSVDGEIVIKGPNVMKGYHNLDSETDAVMTPNGGFRTGDLGRLDDDGFLYITGRIKEQYKLENGKYVVPAPLEEILQLSPLVNQAFIHGANKVFNVALIVPDRPALEKWAQKRGLSQSYEELLDLPQVRELFEEELKQQGQDFKSYERPKKFKLIAEEFSVDNGMLTPKMSLKRKIVTDVYGDAIEALYAS